MDGNVSFAVGTQIDGVVTRDPEEVPVAKILDYVSPAELERYENQDFFDEDERERLLPPKKPRGRPRLGDTIVPSFSVAPIGEETSREQSLLPKDFIFLKRKPGRPRGSDNRIGSKFTSVKISNPDKKTAPIITRTKPSILLESSTTAKRTRGRPPRQKNVAVVIPSFNGPQPQELESTPGTESENDEMLEHPKPQYSMVVASGLGQSDTDDMTSRDVSVELEPPSNKRRLGTSDASIDLNLDDNDDNKSPHPIKKAKTLPETSPDPIASDSVALLSQFQARVYGPDRPAKSSTVPHRKFKPSPTLDGSTAPPRQLHEYTRPSSPDASSSDSLMGPTPRPLKPLPKQYVPSKPLSGEVSLPQRPPQKDNPAKVPASYLNKSIMASHSPHNLPTKTPPTKTTSPSKTIPRKVSLTPHFPPNASFSHSKSANSSADRKPQRSNSSSSRPAPSQSSNTTFSHTTRIMPSPPKKRKASPVPRNAPPKSSQSSATSRIGFAGIPLAEDITDYFAPRATVAKPAPAPVPVEAPHSPSLQLLGPEDNESEDQLARTSSTDSLNSDIIVVRHNRLTPSTAAAAAVAAEARPQESSNSHDRTQLHMSDDNSSDDSSEDTSEDEHEDKSRVSNAAAPIPVHSRADPKKAQSSAEALSKAFEIEDDDDDDSDSESDSLSSEVMVVRTG